MTTLIIEPKNEADYQLFVSLAKRLKVKFREQTQTDDEQRKKKFFNTSKKTTLHYKKERLKQGLPLILG